MLFIFINAALAEVGGDGPEASEGAGEEILPAVAPLTRAVFSFSSSRPAWGFPAKSLMVQDVTDVDDVLDSESESSLCSVTAR